MHQVFIPSGLSGYSWTGAKSHEVPHRGLAPAGSVCRTVKDLGFFPFSLFSSWWKLLVLWCVTLGHIEHCLFEECQALQVCSGIESPVLGEGEMEVRFKEQGVSGLQCKALLARDQPPNGIQQSALDRCNFISL